MREMYRLTLSGPVLLDGGEVEALEAERAIRQALPVRRQTLLFSISAECQRRLSALASSYPEGEVASWPAQVKEAEALQADAQAGAPLLAAIAAARGIPLPELASRVLAKSAAYAAASGAIIGRRQALEDAVGAAQTADDLAAIDITSGWPT